MKKLPYIEDYILLMATDMLLWPPKDPIIKLARYDEPIVNSMAQQIEDQLGFTDRQALLAHKIVIKYRKQWASNDYDVSDQVDNALFRLPIRTIDRTNSISIVDNQIQIKFPYDQNLISVIRAAVTEYPGSLTFDRDLRAWCCNLIEPRILWAIEFGTKHGFSISDELVQLKTQIDSHLDHAIELQYNNGQLEITNAAETLIDYVNQHGGFGRDNLVTLIDLSGQLAYTVHPNVYALVDTSISDLAAQLLGTKSINLEFDRVIDLEPVFEYARIANRYPIYIYESGATQLRREMTRHFGREDIIDRKLDPENKNTAPVIYFSHWRSADSNMPLLITTHTLMIGNRRQQMLQSSEKIIYYTQRTDNAGM